VVGRGGGGEGTRRSESTSSTMLPSISGMSISLEELSPLEV